MKRLDLVHHLVVIPLRLRISWPLLRLALHGAPGPFSVGGAEL